MSRKSRAKRLRLLSLKRAGWPMGVGGAEWRARYPDDKDCMEMARVNKESRARRLKLLKVAAEDQRPEVTCEDIYERITKATDSLNQALALYDEACKDLQSELCTMAGETLDEAINILAKLLEMQKDMGCEDSKKKKEARRNKLNKIAEELTPGIHTLLLFSPKNHP